MVETIKNHPKETKLERERERERESFDVFCRGQLERNRGEGWK